MAKDEWMQKAFSKNKGRLHRKLGVPENEPIPQIKLKAAYGKAKKRGDIKTLREINLAKRGAAIARKYKRKTNRRRMTSTERSVLKAIKGGKK